MKYKMNITNSYYYLIYFFDTIGIDFYMSYPTINSDRKCTIKFENIAINMDEERWRNQILILNPDSIINKSDDMVILLKKATLTIENTKNTNVSLVTNSLDSFDSSGLSFGLKDRRIRCSGKAMNYIDTYIYSDIIFSGDVFIEFDEADISIQTIGYDNLISDINIINKINQDSIIRTKSRNEKISEKKLNGIKSPIWDFDFLMSHFAEDEQGYWEATKEYP